MSAIEILNLLVTLILLPAGGALIGALVKGRMEDARLHKLRGTRNIFGRWKGTLHVPTVSKEALTFEFCSTSFLNPRYWFNPRLVIAKITIADHLLEGRGGFCSEEYLIMDYRSAGKEHFQFGTIMLKLDSSGKFFEGNCLAYYDGPFEGKLVLKKMTDVLTS